MAAQIGKIGGTASVVAKATAARQNGKLGGRPKKPKGLIAACTSAAARPPLFSNRDRSRQTPSGDMSPHIKKPHVAEWLFLTCHGLVQKTPGGWSVQYRIESRQSVIHHLPRSRFQKLSCSCRQVHSHTLIDKRRALRLRTAACQVRREACLTGKITALGDRCNDSQP